MYTTHRQKNYADVRRRSLEFEVGDMVFLRVSSMKGVLRSGHKGKLSPHFIGHFKILEKIHLVTYKLALPLSLSSVHDVFHISMLRKNMTDSTHVLGYKSMTLRSNLESMMVTLRYQDNSLQN